MLNNIDKMQNIILSKRTIQLKIRPTWKRDTLGLSQNDIDLKNALIKCGVEVTTTEIFKLVEGVIRQQTILDFSTMSNINK